LLAASPTNWGISGIFSFVPVRHGFPPTLADLLQEMGRAFHGPHSVGNLHNRHHVCFKLQSVPVTSLADQAGGEVSQRAFNPVD
jgi:hypothetical protein